MDLEYITEQQYSDYFGGDIPSNAERLEYMSLLIFDSSIVPKFPTPEEVAELGADCQKSVQVAFMEQIKYLDSFPETDLQLSPLAGGFSVGKYSESGGSNYGGSTGERLAPNAKAALAHCYEFDFTYAGVNNREC